MKRYHFVFICFLVFMLIVQPIATITVQAEEQNSSKGIDNIGSEIEQYVAKHSDTTAGMSVSIFNANETIYSENFGYMDVQNKILVTEETVMEWGSVSKLLVWISVMQLAEQGKIDLETDINEYLPDNFLHNLTYSKPVTMLNLMNHNAGFEETIIGMATGKEERIISLENYLQEFQPVQVFEPGTVCAYSNWSTTLAAYIVECVSGIPYYEYVRTNIFKPLGMDDSTICADLSDNQSVKAKRMELKIYTTELEEITPNMSYIIMYPAGMCVSTIGDMQRFAQSLLDENTILFDDSDTYHTLFSPSLYFGDTEVGQNYHGFWALESYGTKVIGHSGNTAGCSSSLLLDVENQIGMVIQTNQYVEQIYNSEMPKLIFGGYEGTASDYTGLIMAARTVFHGPLKLYRLMSVISVPESETAMSYDVRTSTHGIDRIACPYGDYLVIGVKDIALDIIVLGLYILALLYCLVNICRCFIKGLIDKSKGRYEKKALGIWCTLSNLIPFLPVAIFAFMIPTLFNFQQWSVTAYRIALFIVFISMLIMLALIIYGFIKFRNSDIRKARRMYIVSINICMIATIVNIIYWNWGMFWMI